MDWQYHRKWRDVSACKAKVPRSKYLGWFCRYDSMRCSTISALFNVRAALIPFVYKFVVQLWFLMKKDVFVQLFRNPSPFWFRLFEYMLIAVMFGSIFIGGRYGSSRLDSCVFQLFVSFCLRRFRIDCDFNSRSLQSLADSLASPIASIWCTSCLQSLCGCRWPACHCSTPRSESSPKKGQPIITPYE
jgi:hypothetical protein